MGYLANYPYKVMRHAMKERIFLQDYLQVFVIISDHLRQRGEVNTPHF